MNKHIDDATNNKIIKKHNNDNIHDDITQTVDNSNIDIRHGTITTAAAATTTTTTTSSFLIVIINKMWHLVSCVRVSRRGVRWGRLSRSLVSA